MRVFQCLLNLKLCMTGIHVVTSSLFSLLPQFESKSSAK